MPAKDFEKIDEENGREKITTTLVFRQICLANKQIEAVLNTIIAV